MYAISDSTSACLQRDTRARPDGAKQLTAPAWTTATRRAFWLLDGCLRAATVEVMRTRSLRGLSVIRTLENSPHSSHTVPNDPYGSHFIGVMNILFPSGERGFIRVISQARSLVGDTELQQRIDEFVQQEAQHARAHSILVQHSEYRGRYTRLATRLSEFFVRVMFGGKKTRLHSLLVFRTATVAAIEHLTAEMGRWIFEDARFAELECDAVTVELLKWHGAEEVVHRAVAFDTLVALSPRWHRLLRSAAMLLWMPVFFATWIICAQALLIDDKTVSKSVLTPARVQRSSRSGAMPGIPMLMHRMAPFFGKAFHPDSVVSPKTDAACVAHLGQPASEYKQQRSQEQRNLYPYYSPLAFA